MADRLGLGLSKAGGDSHPEAVKKVALSLSDPVAA